MLVKGLPLNTRGKGRGMQKKNLRKKIEKPPTYTGGKK